MRNQTRTAAVAAASVLGAGAAAVAAGRYAASRALRPARAAGAAVPAGFEEPLTVHARSAARPPQVALTRSLTAELPGTYGLSGAGVHAVVGHVLHDETHTAPADTVVRRLLDVFEGTLTTGDTVRLTPALHAGRPEDVLAPDGTETGIETAHGTLPAWFVPGDRDVWVVAAHGLGATRTHPLNLLPVLRRMRLPVLAPAQRGDPGAPGHPDEAGQLGASEWRDLDAAVRHALAHGASRVLLYGWSTGAAMALRAAANSEVRGRIGGLVLDSPVLDPTATLRALATAHGVPRFLLPLAMRAAAGRTRPEPEPPEAAFDPAQLTVPVLLVHGPDDTFAPWEASRDFAGRRPDLVTLHTVPRAEHAAMWNAAPEGYEEALRRFLMPLL